MLFLDMSVGVFWKTIASDAEESKDHPHPCGWDPASVKGPEENENVSKGSWHAHPCLSSVTGWHASWTLTGIHDIPLSSPPLNDTTSFPSSPHPRLEGCAINCSRSYNRLAKYICMCASVYYLSIYHLPIICLLSIIHLSTHLSTYLLSICHLSPIHLSTHLSTYLLSIIHLSSSIYPSTIYPPIICHLSSIYLSTYLLSICHPSIIRLSIIYQFIIYVLIYHI